MEETEVREPARVLRSDDWAALQRLRARGDDLSTPRQTAVFFCRRNGDARGASDLFDAVAAAASLSGLAARERDDDKLVLQGELYVHPQALEFLVEWAERWAEHAGIVFDGWECVVIGVESAVDRPAASASTPEPA